MDHFWSDFDAHPYTGNVFFHVFSRFFSTWKSFETFLLQRIWMAIWPQIFFCKKACFFLFMKKVVNAKILKKACIFRDFLCFCVKKYKKWKNTSPRYFAAGTHKNWGVWRGVKIAFKGRRRVCKRGKSRWNCPCGFLLLSNSWRSSWRSQSKLQV